MEMDIKVTKGRLGQGDLTSGDFILFYFWYLRQGLMKLRLAFKFLCGHDDLELFVGLPSLPKCWDFILVVCECESVCVCVCVLCNIK